MPNTYHVSILSLDEIHSLTGAWGNDDLRKVLALAAADDIGEIADGDLEEICLMSLQDIGNQRAGEIVLEAVFAESMRPGVRQNLVDDLEEDQPWNDFAQISQQRGCVEHFPSRGSAQVNVGDAALRAGEQIITGSAPWLAVAAAPPRTSATLPSSFMSAA